MVEVVELQVLQPLVQEQLKTNLLASELSLAMVDVEEEEQVEVPTLQGSSISNCLSDEDKDHVSWLVEEAIDEQAQGGFVVECSNEEANLMVDHLYLVTS